jgi:hypothetical protein
MPLKYTALLLLHMLPEEHMTQMLSTISPALLHSVT